MTDPRSDLWAATAHAGPPPSPVEGGPAGTQTVGVSGMPAGSTTGLRSPAVKVIDHAISISPGPVRPVEEAVAHPV
jgi:hypothetical protein